MKNFLNNNKIFIAVVLGTILLLVGGVFLFSKNSTSQSSGPKIASNLLEPAGGQKTGGKVNGEYIAASKTATVSLTEFGDYQCPACSAYSTLVTQVITDFAGKLSYSFKNFPLSQHTNAPISSYAAEAAGLQGKYWEMHELLYKNQQSWDDSTDAKSIFMTYAKDLGLNVDQFGKDIDSSKVKGFVQTDLADGRTINIDSTPTFFVNGVKIASPQSLEDFKKTIQAAIDSSQVAEASEETPFHTHFDLKVYENGIPVNFALDKYQQSNTNKLNENIHFHDGNGKVVHIHKAGVTLKDFLDSVKISLPQNVTAYVNGKKVEDIASYQPQDLDQILVGSSLLSTVSKDACIYSLKCPERGTPPPEDCVGGIGSGCTEE
jgi:protein-disulfide isomerase